jgi:hypothetical protein
MSVVGLQRSRGWRTSKAFTSLLHFIILLHWKTGLSMPKFLAGYHYNEEEISRHLKKERKILVGPNEFATGQILKKTSRSCEGADLAG